jgi:hypothetical protein
MPAVCSAALCIAGEAEQLNAIALLHMAEGLAMHPALCMFVVHPAHTSRTTQLVLR